MKNRSIISLICVFSFWGFVDTGDLFASDKSGLTVNDFTYSCWPNGWRKNTNDQSADIFGIETSSYGFLLDLADLQKVQFGLLDNPASYEEALKHKTENVNKLPLAQLLVELEVDGVRYRAKTCKAGQDKGVKHLSSVRQWESGRYVQHYDFLELDFRNSMGEKLACDATLDLVAWPKNLTFTLEVSTDHSYSNAVMRLALKSKEQNWNQEVEVKGPWNKGEKKSVSLTCDVSSSGQVPPASITVDVGNTQRIPVHFDNKKNCYVASVKRLNRSWKTGYTDIRNYDDFKITVDVSGSSIVPFLLDMRPPANITGICPILCDESGRPTGIPVQLSKNWHYSAMGSYLMAYTMLPAEKMRTYTLRVVYGFYGQLPSASHAQLSLIGYNDNAGNGRWDQLAIGCWGETICFDMDMSLVDVAITDIRMLMARQGINGKKWSWTNAGWGGDWLNIQDDSQKKYFQNNLKTAYLSQGPCLTNVKHEGYYGANKDVDFTAQIQTLRTNDYCRTFQKFSYTFTRDVSANKIWLFKIGRTHNYVTPQIAYGNSEGCLEEKDAPNTLKKGDLLLDNVTLTGTAPYWVALQGFETSNSRSKPNGYRALIIREYKVVVSGKTYTNPTISVPIFKAKPTNLDFELLPPAGMTGFKEGDRVELDLEFITLPRVADDYYGPNEAFRKHLTENPNSWKTTYREAVGNDLTVSVSGGKVLQNYPVEIQVEKPEVTVTIKGGIGAVPISFKGVKSTSGTVYQIVNGKRVKFDQSVHSNDFWQTDYDPAVNSYTITYNLPLDELSESTWLFTQGQ